MASKKHYDFEARKPRDLQDWLITGASGFLSTGEDGDQAHVRDRSSAERYRAQLVGRLALANASTAGEVTTPIDGALLDFCMSCHMNIDWYSRRTVRELRYRRAYFVVSLALLGGLPLALYWLSKGMFGMGDASTPTEVTAIVTGLLGVHRGISGWLDSRKAVARYWRACAALKSILYSFENEWKNFAIDSEDDARLMELALETETAKCRRIVDDETQEHFDEMSTPTFDLASMLTGAGTSASAIVTRHAGAAFARAEPRRQAIERLAGIDARISSLRAELRRIEDELVPAIARDDASQVETLEQVRAGVLKKLNAAQIERATVEAATPGIGAS